MMQNVNNPENDATKTIVSFLGSHSQATTIIKVYSSSVPAACDCNSFPTKIISPNKQSNISHTSEDGGKSDWSLTCHSSSGPCGREEKDMDKPKSFVPSPAGKYHGSITLLTLNIFINSDWWTSECFVL